MMDPQSEMDHIKFSYIDNYIYTYLYVENISFVHWYLAKTIYEYTLFFKRNLSNWFHAPIIIIEGPYIWCFLFQLSKFNVT